MQRELGCTAAPPRVQGGLGLRTLSSSQHNSTGSRQECCLPLSKGMPESVICHDPGAQDAQGRFWGRERQSHGHMSIAEMGGQGRRPGRGDVETLLGSFRGCWMLMDSRFLLQIVCKTHV